MKRRVRCPGTCSNSIQVIRARNCSRTSSLFV